MENQAIKELCYAERFAESHIEAKLKRDIYVSLNQLEQWISMSSEKSVKWIIMSVNSEERVTS